MFHFLVYLSFPLSSSDAKHSETTKHFKVLTGPTSSYTQWTAKCFAIGGRLASITSAVEQERAAVAVSTSSKPYIITAMRRIAYHSETFVDGYGRVMTYLWVQFLVVQKIIVIQTCRLNRSTGFSDLSIRLASKHQHKRHLFCIFQLHVEEVGDQNAIGSKVQWPVFTDSMQQWAFVFECKIFTWLFITYHM